MDFEKNLYNKTEKKEKEGDLNTEEATVEIMTSSVTVGGV